MSDNDKDKDDSANDSNISDDRKILDSEKTFDSSWQEFATKFKEKMEYEKMDNAYHKKHQKPKKPT